MTPHARFFAALLLVPAAAGIGACSAGSETRTDGPDPLVASVATAERTDIPETVEGGGTVRAATSAVLSSRIVATVLEVRVRAGDRVRAGQPLVILDGRDLEAARARSAAAVSGSVEGAAAAEADEAAARASLVLAQASFRRIDALRGRNSATPAELDEATAALRAAEARVTAARARAVERTRAVDAARADATAAAATAGYATITAPFHGIVASRSIDPGVVASPGVALLTIEDDRVFRLEVSADAARVAAVAPGLRVPVTIGAAATSVEGVVAEVARTVDPAVHALLVKIDLPRIEGLRSGTFGRAQLPGTVRTALTVPRTAVVRRGQLSLVFVESGGAARMRVVHQGRTHGDRIEVLAGIAAGERVVVDPPADLTDGRPLTVSPGRSQ